MTEPADDRGPTRRSLIAGASAVAALSGFGIAGRAAAAEPRALPQGFLWGAAVAGYQVEGGNTNADQWFLEHHATQLFPEKSGDACDHYHHFAEDIALLADLGLNSFRFSLEWSRIEPAEGEFSHAELDHYRAVAACCRDHGVAPLVTFNHYTAPLWFARRGGWEAADAPDFFARYCAFAVKGVGDLAALAATFNEPQGARLLPWVAPQFAGVIDAQIVANSKAAAVPLFSTMLVGHQDRMLPNLLAAHEKGYAAIKAGPGEFPVGVTLAIVDDQAVGPDSRRNAKRAEVNGAWLDAAKRTGDFVGVQTYARARVDRNGVMKPPEGATLNQVGEEIYPAALGNAIRYVHAAVGKPIYVTENGLATTDDRQRAAYIPAALAGVRACLDDGIPVRGYIHWSLLDNYEWGTFKTRYGLVAVDRETQRRTVKPSAVVLGDIARANRA